MTTKNNKVKVKVKIYIIKLNAEDKAFGVVFLIDFLKNQ